jgi:hypothetical protein
MLTYHPVLFRDSKVKRRILEVCEPLVYKQYGLRRVAEELGAVWDDIDSVWIFADGTRCGCMLHSVLGDTILSFKYDTPLPGQMH